MVSGMRKTCLKVIDRGCGNSREELLGILVHAMPYMGFPRMLNALNSLIDVI